MKRLLTFGIVATPLLVFFVLSVSTMAFPTFARKYKTSCSTCHYAFPRLNKFGRAFYNNGFRYPGDDKDYAKEEAVSLGAEAQKKVFPKAIWPSDIPGTSPVSFVWESRMHYVPNATGDEFSFENPHAIAAVAGGTLGDNISFHFHLEWEHVEEFGYGGWLDFKFADPFHVRVGNLDIMPYDNEHRLTREDYNFEDVVQVDGSGLQVWGAVNGAKNEGGLVWAAGVVNGENDGVDNVDQNSAKDVFAKASYKIRGMGVLGSTESSQTSAFWQDDYSITLGGFGHFGRSSDETKRRDFGGNFDLFARDLNVFGLLLLSQEKAPDTADYVDTKVAFVEGDYVIYPWLIPVARFEYTDPESSGPVRRIVPGIVFMVRANVKVTPSGRIDLNNSDDNRFNIDIMAGF